MKSIELLSLRELSVWLHMPALLSHGFSEFLNAESMFEDTNLALEPGLDDDVLHWFCVGCRDKCKEHGGCPVSDSEWDGIHGCEEL